MDKEFQQIIKDCTKSKRIEEQEVIQNLWSGYGKILRYKIISGKVESVVVKHVKYPDKTNHPRGWNTDISHQRKLQSYQVETDFYQSYASKCDAACYLPKCFAVEHRENEVLIVMEDLDASGFPGRKSLVTLNEMKLCLSWLANFHATFMGINPEKLWPVGTYWHLDTRPEELEALEDISLKNAAKNIDTKLNQAQFKTFVHGDAKLANFCFSENSKKVAAVDFQYIGGGCGMKDVAYFIGSCLYEEDCDKYENELLDFYFKALQKALKVNNSVFNFIALEKEWRALFPVAWTDFHRFIKGWSPGHWKINSYSERLAQRVIGQIN